MTWYFNRTCKQTTNTQKHTRWKHYDLIIVGDKQKSVPPELWPGDVPTLQWCHNGFDGVLNHQPHNGLLKHLFRRRSKKTSKLCATGLWVWNSPVTSEFPTQMASNVENVSIWWHHHEVDNLLVYFFYWLVCLPTEIMLCGMIIMINSSCGVAFSALLKMPFFTLFCWTWLLILGSMVSH